MKKILVWLKKRKVIVISVMLNVMLLFSTGYYYFENYQAELLLKRTVIPMQTYYSPQKNPLKTGGYYLFTSTKNVVEIMTPDQKTVLNARYKTIGNGVFELEDDLGYIVSDKNGLRMELNDKNPEIFDYYINSGGPGKTLVNSKWEK